MINLSLSQTHQALKEKKFSSAELTKAYLNRIEALNEKLNAFVTVTPELALEQAKKIDSAGDFSNPLSGIPMNLKDVICTAGVRTTACSRILENFVPPYNAHVYDRLLESGAVLLGKTNTDEFAMGSSSENSCFGPTRNPWNLDYVPGGSSGGPAASVAADMSAFSLGTSLGSKSPMAVCQGMGS
jgi:aspartyl-tRNA(Asn)/glutamyl-tRNA(Gln) amidotransferase subunit A